MTNREEIRLAESAARKKHWKRWGPYLSERVDNHPNESLTAITKYEKKDYESVRRKSCSDHGRE